MTDGGMLLSVRDLHGWYGESHILHGIDFDIAPGEVVTLLGRNGAGKTTTLRAIMGILSRREGIIEIFGSNTIAFKPHNIMRLGVAYCPEERGIFSSLNVHENLMLPSEISEDGMNLDELFLTFPVLKERRHSQGTSLSGGEQQMLAIARILRTGAKFLLLDEPTEGLAPVIVKQIGNLVGRLKNKGYTILLVEQNIKFASQFADRHYLIEDGSIVDTIPREEFEAKLTYIHSRLGV